VPKQDGQEVWPTPVVWSTAEGDRHAYELMALKVNADLALSPVYTFLRTLDRGNQNRKWHGCVRPGTSCEASGAQAIRAARLRHTAQAFLSKLTRRLLPQPGGFEGIRQIATVFEANDPCRRGMSRREPLLFE
jgi:hypothetical protein